MASSGRFSVSNPSSERRDNSSNLFVGNNGIIGHQDALQQIALEAFVFWPLQIAEHMLIIGEGLQDPELKQLAFRYHYEWVAFIPQQHNDDIRYDMVDWNRLFLLIEQTKAYQVQLRQRIESCYGKQEGMHPFGSISGGYMEHITEELDYFDRKVHREPISIDEEFLFWIDIFADHAAAVSGFFDPRERNSINRGNAFADRLLQTHDRYEALLKQRGGVTKIKGSDLLRVVDPNRQPDEEIRVMQQVCIENSKSMERWYQDFITQMNLCKVQTTIHPVLANHIERENVYGLELLEFLLRLD